MPRSIFSLLFIPIISFVGTWVTSAAAQQDVQPDRQFRFNYGATIGELPVGSDVKIWVPIPPTNGQQKVEISALDVPAAIHFANDATYGNRMGLIQIRVAENDSVNFQIAYDVTRKEATQYRSDKPLSTTDLAVLLASNKLVPITGRPLELINGLSVNNDELHTGRRIYDTVLSHLNYDKSKPGYGNGDVLWACDSRTGNCTDFHSVFMSLMRSRGIPTKFEIGFSIPDENSGPLTGYHCWAWFYSKEQGWIPVDISEADKHPELTDYYFGKLTPNRITFTTGRDIPLIKQPETKLNYFIYPYVEVNGEPLDQAKIQLNLSYENLSDVGAAE